MTDALNATKAAVEEGIVPGNVSFKVHGMFMLISALFRFQNSPPNSTMQKEDSPSHQNVGTCMEY